MQRTRARIITTIFATAAVVAIGVAAPDGFAARAAIHLGAGEDGSLVAEVGAPLRAQPDVSWNQTPTSARAAYDQFIRIAPGSWRSLWDTQRGVPLRLYGAGIAAPDTIHSATEAERVALQTARTHAALLAPGGDIGEFVVVSNVLDRSGIRSVGLVQRRCGHRVIGGQLSFRFKHDRLIVIASEAFPDVPCMRSATPVPQMIADAGARNFVATRYGGAPATVPTPDEILVLPMLRDDAAGSIDYRLVRQLRVDSTDPIGSWEIYADATTGETLARRQRLSFANGTISVRAPERYWAGSRKIYPGQRMSLTVAGQNMTSGLDGGFSWNGASTSISARGTGPDVSVTNRGGSAATFSAMINDGGSVTWDSDQGEFIDAELTTFVHSMIVKEWLHRVDPGSDFYAAQLPAFVNLSGSCNAFSDGTAINFLRAGNGCGNTGRIADVVYHEFGHSMHNHALIPGVGQWDGALSEGLGDFLSATITGDPAVAPGFFGEGSILRHCDPANSEHVWPDDRGAIHHTGKIYCGTMFDLRKNLVSALGETEGVRVTNQLFYDSFRRASNIPTTYVELLAADDDDGNLANGTPNECAINDAYLRHGMGDPDRATEAPLGKPVEDGRIIRLVPPSSDFCPGGGVERAELEWRLQGSNDVGGVVEFVESDDELAAEIPRVPWGSVIRYQVRVSMGNGDTRVFPQNAADDFYQMFVGEGEAIHCSDFEGPTPPADWEHFLVDGEDVEGADDWQWGPVLGAPGSGDPSAAFSGEAVWGNDLGGGNFNGIYQGEKENALVSPIIDASGYEVVRLQYRRWLNVEDGAYDVASIEVGDTDADGSRGSVVWTNLDSGGGINHTDREWRFHDVDLTGALAAPGRVTFRLDTDQGTDMGGWTIDDFCVVAYNLPVCGNGAVEGFEECDDGNNTDGDGCDSACGVPGPNCGDGIVDDDEACDDGNDTDGDGCSSSCTSEPGTGDQDPETSGCGCSANDGASGSVVLMLGILFLGLRRRRRRPAVSGG